MRGIGLVVASSTNKEVPGIKYFVENLLLNVTGSSGVESVLKTPLHADILVGGSRGEEQDGDALYRRNFHPGFVRFPSLCLFALHSKVLIMILYICIF